MKNFLLIILIILIALIADSYYFGLNYTVALYLKKKKSLTSPCILFLSRQTEKYGAIFSVLKNKLKQ